jgi:hypothetical protein
MTVAVITNPEENALNRKNQEMSSRELLARIGLNDQASLNHLDDEPLEDLSGNLGAVLRTRYQLLNQSHRLRPGELVTWKPGLRNRQIPRYGHRLCGGD